MKKKISIIAITLALLLLVAGCTSKKVETKDDPSNAGTVPGSAEVVTQDALDNKAMAVSTSSEKVEFQVNIEYPLEEDAWLGFVPTGTKYNSELEADEVDFLYTYCSNYGYDGATSYLFEFNKEEIDNIEDGSYDLVLCSSDNGEIGRVMLQIGIDKQGNNLALDFANEK